MARPTASSSATPLPRAQKTSADRWLMHGRTAIRPRMASGWPSGRFCGSRRAPTGLSGRAKIDSRVFSRRRALGVARSRPVSRAGGQQSSPHLCRNYVPARVARDRRSLRHRTSGQSSAGCSRNTWEGSVPRPAPAGSGHFVRSHAKSGGSGSGMRPRRTSFTRLRRAASDPPPCRATYQISRRRQKKRCYSWSLLCRSE